MEANGTTKTPTETLRGERRLLREQIAVAKLRQEKKLLEAFGTLADDFNFGGTDLWYRLRDSSGRFSVPPSVPSDRRHGANWPMWRTWQELAELRQRSRVILATNPYAQALVENLTNYVIGTGCKYKVEPRKGQPDGVQVIADQVQAWVDQWCKKNRWNCSVDPFDTLVMADSREREIMRRVIRDGEAFIRIYYEDDGSSQIRALEPERIMNPGGVTEQEGWFCGILHQMYPYEDVERREKYFAFWQDPSYGQGDHRGNLGEEIDAENVVHVMAPNTDASIGRGTPAFSFGVGDAFERALKLERNASSGASVRAAIAMIWKNVFATQGQVQNMTNLLNQARSTTGFNTTGTSATSNSNTRQVREATIIDVPEGREPVAVPIDYTPSYLNGVQADLRAGLGAFCAPEYWSASTEGGNYSNLETASAPTVKMGEVRQEHFKACFLAVLWRAIRWAVKCGELPGAAMTVLDVQCEGPTVLHRNGLEKSQQDQIDIQLGKKSVQTAAMEDGLDWDMEAKNKQAFEEMFPPVLPGLEMPGEEGDKLKPPAPVKEGEARAG